MKTLYINHIIACYSLFFWIYLSGNISYQVSDLSLDQKIGQLFMVAAVADEEIAQKCIAAKPYRMDKEYIEFLINTYHIGGIIFLGQSDVTKQIERTHYFQTISSIPLLIGQDLEPGRVGASRFPHNWKFPSMQSLGDIDNPLYTYSIGYNIGQFCSQLGVHINFAPVADINNNPNNPVINNRSAGAEPQHVTIHALAFAQGLHNAGIIPCVKHFPGHGDTAIDSHYDLPVLPHSINRLKNIELVPFKTLIQKNIPAIMIGHLAVPALDSSNLPATLSPTIVTTILQKQLQFGGLIITDALDMHAITQRYSNGQAELLALLAGNDILLCPVDVPAAVATIKQALLEGTLSENDLNKHVEKIVRIKKELFTSI